MALDAGAARQGFFGAASLQPGGCALKPVLTTCLPRIVITNASNLLDFRKSSMELNCFSFGGAKCHLQARRGVWFSENYLSYAKK